MELDNETYDKIDAYLSNTMQPEERKAFEKEIGANEALKKEVILQKGIKSAISEKDWPLRQQDEFDKEQVSEITSYRNTDEFKNAQQAIRQTGDTYFEKKQKKKQKIWIYYLSGAAAVLLILIGLKFSVNQSLPRLYDEYNNWNELPSITVQGNENQLLAKGEALFHEQKYEEAIATFRSVEQRYLKENTINPYIYIYIGVSYLETGNTDNALAYFEKLEHSNTLDSSRAHWYKALLFLKTNETKKAKKELDIILRDKDNFRYTKAKELVKKID